MRITSQRPNFQGAVKGHFGLWHKVWLTGHNCKEKAEKMIRAYFPAKYGLDRSSTDDMEEERVTQRLRLEIAPRTISKTSMNTNHAAPIANGSHISRLLSHGIIEGPGLQKQSLGYSGPEESVECALITVLQ